MLEFNEDKFLKHLENIKLNHPQTKNVCEIYINDVLVKNVPYKPHEIKNEERFQIKNLNLIYKYIRNHPEEKEIDFNNIK